MLKKSEQHAIIIPGLDDIAQSPPIRSTMYTSAEEQGREKRPGEEEFRVKLFAGFNGVPLSENYVKEALDALAKIYPDHPTYTNRLEQSPESSKLSDAPPVGSSKLVRTPFGDRQSRNVHLVPEGTYHKSKNIDDHVSNINFV